MATYGLSMSQSWCSGQYDITHSVSGRNATITVTLRLWRNDGGRSYNYDARNNFYINIGGSVQYFTVNQITGSGVSLSHSRTYTTDAAGNVSVAVEVGGSLSGTTFAITGGNSRSYTATGAQKATWTVHFDANGGSGEPGNQTKTYGSILTLSSTKPTRPGYEFLGWGTSPGDTTPDYQPGSQYGSDADITLYAIWQILELIKFSANDYDLKIPSQSNGMGSVPDIKIPFTVLSTDDNYTLNFYYRVCYVDNSSGTVLDPETNSKGLIYGPFTAKDIADGGGDDSGFNIPISGEMVKQCILNCQSETQIKFLVQVCTTNNQFSEVLTEELLINVNLINFRFVSISVSECYRSNSTTLYAALELKYPASYVSYISNPSNLAKPKVFLDDNDEATDITYVSSGSSINSDGTIVYVLNQTITTEAHKLKFEITDGISSAYVISRIGANGVENIYLCNDNTIEAIEFIEDSYSGFKKGGRLIAQEIVEGEDGIYIGDTKLDCKEIIEI